MRFIRTKAAIAVAGLALSLAACGDAGVDTRASTSRCRRTPSFDDGHPHGRARRRRHDQRRREVRPARPRLQRDRLRHARPASTSTIAKILVASLGIDPEDTSKVKYIETISDNREPFLEDGKVDLVLASYSITDERRAVVGQAGPYMVTGQQLLVPEDSERRAAPTTCRARRSAP